MKTEGPNQNLPELIAVDQQFCLILPCLDISSKRETRSAGCALFTFNLRASYCYQYISWCTDGWASVLCVTSTLPQPVSYVLSSRNIAERGRVFENLIWIKMAHGTERSTTASLSSPTVLPNPHIFIQQKLPGSFLLGLGSGDGEKKAKENSTKTRHHRGGMQMERWWWQLYWTFIWLQSKARWSSYQRSRKAVERAMGTNLYTSGTYKSGLLSLSQSLLLPSSSREMGKIPCFFFLLLFHFCSYIPPSDQTRPEIRIIFIRVRFLWSFSLYQMKQQDENVIRSTLSFHFTKQPWIPSVPRSPCPGCTCDLTSWVFFHFFLTKSGFLCRICFNCMANLHPRLLSRHNVDIPVDVWWVRVFENEPLQLCD